MPALTGVDHVVLVLLDSLARHHVGGYGGTEAATPNLDRLIRRGVRFDRHHAGSLPCIPARHDLLCGALDFLWRPWGSIEAWERPITRALRDAGVVTQLVTDHPHLFERGGENYHTEFGAWDYQRGHESDHWQTIPGMTPVSPSFGRGTEHPYYRSRRRFLSEEDFPGPKTMRAAAQWLDENAGLHAKSFLFVDEFDPHEPFDVPEPFASMYDPDWSGGHLIWPPYLTSGIDAREGRQIRAQYLGKLTMIDAWLGRLLDVLDRRALWDNTMVILTSDHGIYLGEHDTWGKPPSPVYDTLGLLPLTIAYPGCAAGTTCSALTTTVDLSATLLDLFGARAPRHRQHGRSLLPVLRGEATSIREHVLQGYWSQRVQIVFEGTKYARGVVDPERLALYSNRWSTLEPFDLPSPDERAELARMPGSKVPVIKQPLDATQRTRIVWTWGDHRGDRLFDLDGDPGETRDLASEPARVARATEALRAALTEVEAPVEQYERLGLTPR